MRTPYIFKLTRRFVKAVLIERTVERVTLSFAFLAVFIAVFTSVWIEHRIVQERREQRWVVVVEEEERGRGEKAVPVAKHIKTTAAAAENLRIIVVRVKLPFCGVQDSLGLEMEYPPT